MTDPSPPTPPQPPIRASAPGVSPRSWKRLTFRGVLLIVLIAQLAISLTAVRGKSPTFDEPIHAYAGWRSVVHGDLRFNPEHPPVWKFIAALPSVSIPIAEGDNPTYRSGVSNMALLWRVMTEDLFGADPLVGQTLVWRGRVVMGILACGLTIAAAYAARSLAGDGAGAIAAIAVGLDPNTLAHGALVTNDVIVAALYVATALLLARVCDRITWLRVAWLALAIGAAMATKFSGILLAPAAVVCLLLRALFGGPWALNSHWIRTPIERTAAAIGLTLALALSSWLIVWATYGFREVVTSDGQRFPSALLKADMRWARARAQIFPRLSPTPADLAAYEPGVVDRTLLAIDRLHVMPNAWTYGMAFATSRAGVRCAFLLGEHDDRGWWYYFPVALAFKAPAPTLLAIVGGGFACVFFARQWWLRLDPRRRWVVVCVGVCTFVYTASLVTGNLNIGFRHFFPSYYLLIVLASAVLAHWVRTRRAARFVVGGMSIVLLAGVVWTYPNFIAYFNLPSRAIGSPTQLLSDSNVDWGQDLPLLARWQREHPDVPLYLSYFGSVPPEAYGVHATPANPVYVLGPPGQPITRPGVWAVSASWMVEENCPATADQNVPLPFGRVKPREVLGGSIFLYDVPFAP